MKKILDIIKKHNFLIKGFLIFIVFAFLVEKFAILPLKTKRDMLYSKFNTLLNEKKQLESTVISLTKEFQELERNESTLTNFFILKNRVVDLKKSSIFLNKLVDFDGLKILNLAPGKKEKVSNLTKWLITITVSGNYSDINAYLNYLEKLPYTLNIVKVELSKINGQKGNSAEIFVEVVAK